MHIKDYTFYIQMKKIFVDMGPDYNKEQAKIWLNKIYE
jgi:hypothetical protein